MNGWRSPAVSAPDQFGQEVNMKTATSGPWAVVFFYPKANTPGCTAEACDLRDHYQELLDKGFEIVGVSADDTNKQTKFKEKYNFPFPLLADTEKEVLHAFGVWGPKKFMGREYDGIHRMTFVVENGIVTRVIDKVKTKAHAAQILEA